MTNPYAPPDPSRDAPPTPAGPSHPDAPDAPRADGTHPDVPWMHPSLTQLPGPPVPPEPRPVDEVLSARAARQARVFGLLVLASVLVSTLPLPWQSAALVFALGGLVVGARALVLTLRSGARGGLPAALGLGVAVTLFWSFVAGGMLLLWPVQAARQECVSQALTLTAQRACEQQFEQDLKDWQTRLEERATNA
ncbi:hypothetical protein ACTHAM_000203 [Cellulomonas soli]|uniref:hypothetical protein n=1 Tax=Cellulomonas soli TaxID=931535 RepID=UPI003F84F1D8